MQQTSLNFLQQQIIDRVSECISRASLHFNRQFKPPRVTFNQRGKIAGSARLHLNELRFNRILLLDNAEIFLSDVVPHEVCHLLAHQLFGRVKPHGKEWQQLMAQVFDVAPAPYHSMDVSKVVGKKFSYRCHCGLVELSIRRHNKVLRKVQQYRCVKCGNLLVAA